MSIYSDPRCFPFGSKRLFKIALHAERINNVLNETKVEKAKYLIRNVGHTKIGFEFERKRGWAWSDSTSRKLVQHHLVLSYFCPLFPRKRISITFAIKVANCQLTFVGLSFYF